MNIQYLDTAHQRTTTTTIIIITIISDIEHV